MEYSEALFVYGTLKNSVTQQEVFGRVVVGRSDTLLGYKKSSVIISGKKYPALIVDGAGIINGLIIFVSPSELQRIDSYETSAYTRIGVNVESGFLVWVYIKTIA